MTELTIRPEEIRDAIERNVAAYSPGTAREEVGRVMETGPMEEVITNPRHPYTQGLVAAAPVPHPAEQAERRAKWLELQEHKNAMTGVFNMQPPAIVGGCPYYNRCTISTDVCTKGMPPLRDIGEVKVACHHAK